jgi:protein involved in polysaccharide export with SLBB domain
MIQQTLRSLTLLVVAAVSVTGCATTRPAATVSATNLDAEAHRRVIAGDRLEIVAYTQGFDSLLVVNVDERGRVTLPRVGEVEVGGLPADLVRERIQQGFGEYFVDTPGQRAPPAPRLSPRRSARAGLVLARRDDLGA